MRAFVDEDSIGAGDFWEMRIQNALEESVVLVPLYSPTYFDSDWCRKEYDAFIRAEAELKEDGLVGPDDSLVLPVVLEHGDPADQEREAEVLSRQATDLVGLRVEEPTYERRVGGLVGSLCERLDLGDEIRKGAVGPRRLSAPERIESTVATYTGSDLGHLIRLLRECRSAIVVGVANEGLPTVVERALEWRRRRFGAHGFWESLDVVFLEESALQHVHDDLSAEFVGEQDAVLQRSERLGWSRRRLMSLLVREGANGRWSIRSGSWLGHSPGYYFKFQDRPDVALLEIPRPGRSSRESSFVEFSGAQATSFESGFEDIVRAAPEEHEMVLVGAPSVGGGFACKGAKVRRSVLRSEGASTACIAAVVALTWMASQEGAQPLLQLNLPRNSTREMMKISHVSGYVNLSDLVGQGADDRIRGRVVDEAVGRAAVVRELAADFGIAERQVSISLIDDVEFFYHDNEDLHFHVFGVEVDPGVSFVDTASMYRWEIDELMAVRAFQTLTKLRAIAEARLAEAQRSHALDLVACNLEADGLVEVAGALDAAREGSIKSLELETVVEDAARLRRVVRYPDGRELVAEGLAGLQYRTFYSHLLPYYVAIGVPGSSELQAEIQSNEQRRRAIDRLGEFYADGSFVRSLGVEV